MQTLIRTLIPTRPPRRPTSASLGRVGHAISPQVAPETGPMDLLAGRRIVALADTENLAYGARDLGARLSFAKLGELLRQVSASADLHAFFSREKGDDAREEYFKRRDWTAHPYDIRTVNAGGRAVRHANCDNWILLWASELVRRADPEMVCLCSGDGLLVEDLAAFLSQIAPELRIVTLSLAGSTAQRLRAGLNPHIAVNAEIGRDCLRPIAPSTPHDPSPQGGPNHAPLQILPAAQQPLLPPGLSPIRAALVPPPPLGASPLGALGSAPKPSPRRRRAASQSAQISA